MDSEDGIPIPADSLTPETLRSVIEEFVTRDGTDACEADSKIAQVMRLIERGEAEIWFNPDSGTCNVLLGRDVGR